MVEIKGGWTPAPFEDNCADGVGSRCVQPSIDVSSCFGLYSREERLQLGSRYLGSVWSFDLCSETSMHPFHTPCSLPQTDVRYGAQISC